MKRLAISAILLGQLLLSSSGFAEDWPEFRGPTGQGISSEKNLPTQWSAEENVAWKVPIAGQGWSSPVVQDGKIYLTAAVPSEGNPEDYSLRALCLNAADGAEVWNIELFRQESATSPGIHSKNSHASSTPLIKDGRLYAHFGHQGTACVDLQGNVIWRNTEIKYPPVHGNGGSPVLVAGNLIFSCDGAENPFIVALKSDTGEIAWKTARSTQSKKNFSFSTPLVIDIAGQQQVVSPASDAVIAYDPQTGAELWKVGYEGYSVIPRPVYGHGRIYLSTGYDSAKLLAIRVDGQGETKEPHIEWEVSRGAPNTPSPLLVGEQLFVVADDGIASCINAFTGKPHWTKRIGGNFSASPVFAEGRVYLQDEQGTGTVVAAGEKFEKLATNKLEEATLASYAVADGALFIRSDKHLYRIESPNQQVNR